MLVADISFSFDQAQDQNVVSDLVNSLLGALHKNGQIYNREYRITLSGNTAQTTVLIPEPASLEKKLSNLYVERAMAELSRKGLVEFDVQIRGKDIDSIEICSCSKTKSFILFSNYISPESPLRCGDCFHPVPLYKIPHTDGEEFYNLICWQSDYNSCDALQMHCGTLELAATREMSRHDSSLTKQGINICYIITSATNIPTYYYLYRTGGRSKKQEKMRKCPSCNGDWLLDERLHLFDFKCDKCRLLSNVSWDV